MSELALSGIVVAAILYALGSRGARGGRSQREGSRRATAFYCGLAALAFAIAPPLDDLADRLFWAHMVQHGLLQMIGPALIVLGAPWLVICRRYRSAAAVAPAAGSCSREAPLRSAPSRAR